MPALGPMDVVGPLVGAGLFVAGMSRIPEPLRLRVNALLVAGASGAYIGSSFGLWELLFAAVALGVAFGAQGSYRLVGLAWFLHAGWDVLHHLYGAPIWPFAATSSFGCMVFDSAIAIWLAAGAPDGSALWLALRANDRSA